MTEKDLLFTDSHEWIEAAGDVRAVGITDHAQQLMGDIVFVDQPNKPGKVVAKGDEIATIESPKAAASVYAPMSGEIVAVNDALAAQPELINKECYAGGWIIKIRPAKADAERPAMKDLAAYKAMVGE